MESLLGCYVKPDGWPIGNNLITSDWDKADYRIETNSGGPIKSLACNVEITGRTHQFRSPVTGPAMRCKITFVGHGEDDVITRGWIKWPV